MGRGRNEWDHNHVTGPLMTRIFESVGMGDCIRTVHDGATTNEIMLRHTHGKL